jgi:asparagine synthase (glutamine-hydrolysing)
MCGICGIHDPRGVAGDDIRRMVESLRHRGPDDEGLHLGPRIGLGHRRLSIIDLDTGHQPICNEDGSVWIVFNGEIYNYRDLGARLESRHEFKTRSDTEVLLHLYEDHGEQCLRHLRGMFAFAIYDSRSDKLFAARDHLGQKPLFYSHSQERFCFASEIKALITLDPCLRELDGEALCEYLALRIITPPRSMFRRVRKLPPAHFLVHQNGQLTVERYWELEFEPKLSIDYREAVDELDRQVQASVEHHLVSDVPVGAFLSGGLDSSLIVAMMSRFSPEPVQTFTGDLPYKETSELPYARLVSERYQTRNSELTINPSLVEDLPGVIWHLDEPSDPLSTCLFALSRLARERVKVVLVGDGGDELFAGYDRYYGYRYAGYLAALPRAIREHALGALLGLLPRSTWYRGLTHRISWLQHMSGYDGSARYAKSLRYFYFSDDYMKRILDERFRGTLEFFDPEQGIRRLFDAADEREAVDRMLYADAATRLPDHPVMILDRMSMAHGLEARSPFLDHVLAEFCASLPPAFKIRGRRRRVIQTALAERYVPRRILTRGKQGFASGFTYMMGPQFSVLYDRFLRYSRLVEEGYLNADAVAHVLHEQESGRHDHGSRLWLLLNSELWYRLFIEGQSLEDLRDQMRSALLEETRAVAGEAARSEALQPTRQP